MAGEGGGGTPAGPVPWDEERRKYGVFSYLLGGGSGPPRWARREWIAANVPGFSLDLWNDRASREGLLRRAFDIWQRIQLSSPQGSGLQRRYERLDKKPGRLERKIGAAGAASVRALLHAVRSGTLGPGQGGLDDLTRRSTVPQRPSDPTIDPDPTGGAAPTQPEPSWLQLVKLLLAMREQREREHIEREQIRAQRRALQMSLGDTLGDVFGSLAGAATTIVPQLLQQRAADQTVKNQLRLARFAAGGAAGFPLALGELGAMEDSDLLESLGLATGLEGAVEREAVLYVPTASGLRAVPEIMGRHPQTGRVNVWRNMGRPVLYSGDLATCKRVNKISARVGRVVRRRGTFRRRRR